MSLYLNEEPEVMIDTDCHIRWGIRRDLPETLNIELEAFDFPWCEDEFIEQLRQRNCIWMVAEVCGCIAGYMVYELHRTKFHILNFAVHHNMRRRGIGTLMVNKLKSKLNVSRRAHIDLEIRDANLTAQQFFRAQGFKATGILRDFYRGCRDDAYAFRHSVQECSGK
jgi:ribosomal-protein-alanine N-acetyltransferase